MLCKIVRALSLSGLLILFVLPVYAADTYGSICILPDCGGNRILDGQVALYRVGDLTPEGCRITDGLADWTLRIEEIQSDSFLQWALNQTWDGGMLCRITDENGAVFTELTEGLYLVVQKEAANGYSEFKPFFVSLPMQTNWNVTVNPGVYPLAELPRTGDYPAPIFTAMLLSMGVVFLLVLMENRKK